MADNNKSKEELIEELNELKAILKSNKESTKTLIKNERFLSQIAMDLADLPPSIDIYEFIAKKLNELIENSIISVSVYDAPSATFQMRSVAGLNEKFKKFAEKILGMSLYTVTVPISSLNKTLDNESEKAILDGKIIKMENGLYQVLSATFPQKLTRIVEVALNIGNVYAIGFKSKGELYGIADIFLKKGSELENKEIVQSLIGLFAVALQRRKAENDLEENESKYRKIFENVQDVFYQTDINGKIIDISPSIERYSGFSRNYLIGKPVETVYKDPEERKKMLKIIQEKGEVNDYELILKNKFGGLNHASVNAHHFMDQNNIIIGIEGSLRDITERKEIEAKLSKSENRYRTIFENTGTAMIIFNKEGLVSLINSEMEKLFGIKREKLENQRHWMEFVHPDDLPKMWDYHQKREQDPKSVPSSYETRFLVKDGEIHHAKITVDKIPGSEEYVTSVVDLNDILNAYKKLEKSEKDLKLALKEKEILIKEIHHRVKNNLMVISSLLNIQSKFIKDKAALSVFRESQKRANSMAMIHERLYRSNDLKKIEFGDYIYSLSTDLFHTYVLDPSRVKLKLNVEKVMVDINTSVPLGLIVNELITNSMKYAFPDGESGEISISFHQVDDKYILEVKDNGIGIPKDLDIVNAKSLGLQLVTSLTDQINGDLELNRENGTDFKIIFKEKEFQ